jgi:hypothetical protein
MFFYQFNKYFLFLWITILVADCSSTQRKSLDLQLISSSEDLAVFSIQEQDLSSILPKKLGKASVLIDEDIDVREFLRLISFKSSMFSSESWEPFLRDGDINEISILLTKAISKEPAFGYLILIKKDDPLSPLTKVLRTSLLILKTANGFLLVFPDIRQNMTFATQYKFDDWALYQIPRIFSSRKQELKLKPNKMNVSFYLEDLANDQLLYERIVIVGDERFLPNPQIFIARDIENSQDLKFGNDPAERLKILEDLKNKKLITEDDYQKKKNEILKNL